MLPPHEYNYSYILPNKGEVVKSVRGDILYLSYCLQNSEYSPIIRGTVLCRKVARLRMKLPTKTKALVLDSCYVDTVYISGKGMLTSKYERQEVTKADRALLTYALTEYRTIRPYTFYINNIRIGSALNLGKEVMISPWLVNRIKEIPSNTKIKIVSVFNSAAHTCLLSDLILYSPEEVLKAKSEFESFLQYD